MVFRNADKDTSPHQRSIMGLLVSTLDMVTETKFPIFPVTVIPQKKY